MSIVSDFTGAARQQRVQFISSTLAGNDEPGLRKHLRDELKVVIQVAHALRKQVPGLGNLRMPSDKLPSETLLKSSDAVTKQASTFEAVLVEHGLEADFIAQLESAMDALRRSVDGRGAAVGARANATKQLQVSTELLVQYMRLMDAQLTKGLKNDPAKLREWKNQKHVIPKGVMPAAGAGLAPEMLTIPAATAPALVLTPVEPAEAKAA